MQLESPEHLTRVINDLVLTSAEKFDLNKQLANRARQFFREQIRAQRDIDNKGYQARGRRKITLERKSKRALDNKNMLMGFSRALKTQVSESSFEVGIAGIAGRVARIHNEGQNVSFTTHVNGFYNTRTSRWEGGTKVKNNYTMPKRTFIGWTPALERELLAMVADKFITGAEN